MSLNRRGFRWPRPCFVLQAFFFLYSTHSAAVFYNMFTSSRRRRKRSLSRTFSFFYASRRNLTRTSPFFSGVSLFFLVSLTSCISLSSGPSSPLPFSACFRTKVRLLTDKHRDKEKVKRYIKYRRCNVQEPVRCQWKET